MLNLLQLVKIAKDKKVYVDTRLLKLLFIFFACCQSFFATASNIKHTLTATTTTFRGVSYVRNPDGDTIVVNLPEPIPNVFGHEIPVRIRHINTPELKGLGYCEHVTALRARFVTNSILKNAKQIDLENVGRDKYFRLLSDISIINQEDKIVSLSKYLLDNGFAIAYEGDAKPKVNWCVLSAPLNSH